MTELALPLVVRIERDDPPTRTDALEAAARAVLHLLTADEPDWHDAIRAWDGSRIRKVVRRARGAAWERAGELPCLEIEHGTAQVRVYPPVPNDDWPEDLAKLQVGGTELDDPTEPGPPDAGAPLILLSPHVQLSAGKAMAQVGHAAHLGWRAAKKRQRVTWADNDFAVSVRTASADGWRRVLDLRVPIVSDGGYTEVEPGTQTAAIVLP